jgi:hypothetical protein
MISQEVFTDEKFMDLSFEGRLLWIGLIVNADDDGRLRGSAKVLKAGLFPADDIGMNVIEKLLQIMNNRRMISWYTVDESQYIQINNWQKYQFIRHDRYHESILPRPLCQPTDNQTTTKEPPTGCQPGTETKLNEVKLNKDNKHTKPTIPEIAEYAKSINANIDPEAFFHHYEANGWKQANGNPITKWRSAVVTWKKRAPEFARNGFSGSDTKPKIDTIVPGVNETLAQREVRLAREEGLRNKYSGGKQ